MYKSRKMQMKFDFKSDFDEIQFVELKAHSESKILKLCNIVVI